MLRFTQDDSENVTPSGSEESRMIRKTTEKA